MQLYRCILERVRLMIRSESPEECVLELVSQKRGTQNFISKAHLILLLKDYKC